jgi:site-specific DNA recombinase
VIRIPGGLPQIVDEETFEKVQHLLNKRSNKANMGFKPSPYLLSRLIECGTCHSKIHGATSYRRNLPKPYIRYSHQRYRSGKCKTKEIPTTYLDNWITQIAIPNFITTNDIYNRVKAMNAQILEEKSKLKSEINAIKNQLVKIDEKLETQANSLVKSSFSHFALEEVAMIKDEKGKLVRHQRDLQKRHSMLNKFTVEKIESFIKKTKEKWNQAESMHEKQKVIVWLISKIVVTNEKVSVYVNYDTVTKRLCDFDIEFNSIERDMLIKIWRNKKSN